MRNKNGFNLKFSSGVISFFIVILCLSMILLISAGCDYNFIKKASRADKVNALPVITIGAVWPQDSSFKSFANGIVMAADEINRAGGVIGKKISVVFKDDESNVTRGMIIADEFSGDLEVCAVTGFCDSHVTIPVSNIYNSAGILMMTISATDPAYNSFKSPLLFRTIADADAVAARQAALFKKSGYKKVMICYINDKYGLSSANAAEDELKKHSIAVVDRRSYISGSENEFEQIIDCWKLLKFDCVMVYGDSESSMAFIKMLRRKGVTVPVFCGDGADSPETLRAYGEYSDGLVFVTFFNPNERSQKLVKFEAEYIKKFGIPPESYTAGAYDSIMLIAEGIKHAKSAAPLDVAKSLRSIDNYEGVANNYNFDEYGEVKNMKVTLKIYSGNEFKYLDSSNEVDLIKKASLNNEKWK